jgi:hypothetical protein
MGGPSGSTLRRDLQRSPEITTCESLDRAAHIGHSGAIPNTQLGYRMTDQNGGYARG